MPCPHDSCCPPGSPKPQVCLESLITMAPTQSPPTEYPLGTVTGGSIFGPTCTYTGPSGAEYSLQSLQRVSGYSAQYPSGYVYFYNFCAGVVEGSSDISCGTGTAVCLGDGTLTKFYSCGTLTSASYTEVPSGVDVVYSGGADGRQSTVHLVRVEESKETC